jgi:hypothetical protein
VVFVAKSDSAEELMFITDTHFVSDDISVAPERCLSAALNAEALQAEQERLEPTARV